MDSIVKVTMASTDFNLIDIDALKTELSLTGTDDQRDAWLTDKSERLSEAAAKECDRIFVAQQYQETFRFRGVARELKLRQYPVTEIASVTVNGTALDPATYDFNGDSGILYNLGVCGFIPWPCGTIIVAYTAGFTDVPGDLQEAIIRELKASWFSRTQDPRVVGTSKAGGGETRYWAGSAPGQVGTFSPEVQSMLDKYRRPARI